MKQNTWILDFKFAAAYIRENGMGAWGEPFACLSNVSITYSKENSETLNAWGCWKYTYSDDTATLAATFAKVMNTSVLEKVWDFDYTLIPAGAYTMPTEQVEIGSDLKYTFPYTDVNGDIATSVVVTSKDWGTTYSATTDYTLAVSEGVTIITFTWATLVEWVTVNITWSVEVAETYHYDKKLGTSFDKKYDVKIVALEEINWVEYTSTLTHTDWTNTSWLVLAFLNQQNGGAPTGSEISYMFDENSSKLDDQITPARLAN